MKRNDSLIRTLFRVRSERSEKVSMIVGFSFFMSVELEISHSL